MDVIIGDNIRQSVDTQSRYIMKKKSDTKYKIEKEKRKENNYNSMEGIATKDRRSNLILERIRIFPIKISADSGRSFVLF